jgi:signal transduction histidine kinase
VEDALDSHREAAADRKIRIDTHLEDVAVLGDRRLLATLASNLADNAVRYNLSGGWVEISLAASSESAILAVSNTGSLIPPDQIDRLLQPFQRAAPDRVATNGFGIGLAIVADIAKAHGARLEGQALGHDQPAIR